MGADEVVTALEKEIAAQLREAAELEAQGLHLAARGHWAAARNLQGGIVTLKDFLKEVEWGTCPTCDPNGTEGVTKLCDTCHNCNTGKISCCACKKPRRFGSTLPRRYTIFTQRRCEALSFGLPFRWGAVNRARGRYDWRRDARRREAEDL